MRSATLALLTPRAALAACAGPFAPVCDAKGRFGLAVTVTDARTGTHPAGVVLVVAAEGAYADTARRPDPRAGAPAVFVVVVERPGNYTVAVTAAGYGAWTRSGVSVCRAGRCDTLQTVRLSAALEPLPATQ